MKSVLSILIFFYALVIFNSCDTNKSISKPGFEKIVTGFQTPADTNTIWCYWYWINDDISKEGITKDLEAMKKAGIGGAFIGNINSAGIDLCGGSAPSRSSACGW